MNGTEPTLDCGLSAAEGSARRGAASPAQGHHGPHAPRQPLAPERRTPRGSRLRPNVGTPRGGPLCTSCGTPRFCGQSERPGGDEDRDDHAEAEDEGEQERAARVGARHQGVDATEDEGQRGEAVGRAPAAGADAAALVEGEAEGRQAVEGDDAQPCPERAVPHRERDEDARHAGMQPGVGEQQQAVGGDRDQAGDRQALVPGAHAGGRRGRDELQRRDEAEDRDDPECREAHDAGRAAGQPPGVVEGVEHDGGLGLLGRSGQVADGAPLGATRGRRPVVRSGHGTLRDAAQGGHDLDGAVLVHQQPTVGGQHRAGIARPAQQRDLGQDLGLQRAAPDGGRGEQAGPGRAAGRRVEQVVGGRTVVVEPQPTVNPGGRDPTVC